MSDEQGKENGENFDDNLSKLINRQIQDENIGDEKNEIIPVVFLMKLLLTQSNRIMAK